MWLAQLLLSKIKMKQIFSWTYFSLIQHVLAFESRDLVLKINNFLRWKIPSRPNIEASRCFCVSYGFDIELEIPMLEIDIDNDFVEMERNLLASTDYCFLAFMAIEHRARLPELVAMLHNISDIIQVPPTTIFVMGDEIHDKITWKQQTILTVS